MAERTCSVDSCEKPTGQKGTARGLCSAHYTRLMRWGDPLGSAPKRKRATCKVGDCAEPATGRGWCAYHYACWRYHGDPMAGRPRRPRLPAGQRFWAKVDKDGPGGCWLWAGYLNPTGYGNIKVGPGPVLTHRFAYELLVGPIPDGLELDHLCRVRACCNPAHLEPVTHEENVRRAQGAA